MASMVKSLVSSLVRGMVGEEDGGGGSAPTVLDVSALVATSGSTITPDTTPSTGNAITIPTGYTGLKVYAGGEDGYGLYTGPWAITTKTSTCYLKLWYKINGSLQTDPIVLYRYQSVTIPCAADDVIAFGAATAPVNDPTTFANGSASIVVIPTKPPAAHSTPTATTLTIYPDVTAPPIWAPTQAHLVLTGEYQTIKMVSAAYERHIYIQESKGDNITPIRHVKIPANEETKIDLRYPNVFFGSSTESSFQIVAPYGATVGATGSQWEPSFTAAKTITCSTVNEFWSAMNDSSDNVDVLLNAGTYDLQSNSGRWMTSTNYSNAMSKNRRIRSASGLNDVLFKVATPASEGAQWNVTLFLAATQLQWIFKNISWDMTGIVKFTAGGTPNGALDFGLYNSSAVHFVNCNEYGQTVSVNDSSTGCDTLLKVRCITGSSVCYWIGNTFTDAKDDATAANVQGGTSMTLHQINTYFNGNGSRTDAQVVTNHSGGRQILWGCSFGNLSNGNQCRVASENESSPVFLNYCRAWTANFNTTLGLAVSGSNNVNASFIHFCDFQSFSTADGLKSAVGSTLRGVKTGQAMIAMAYAAPTQFTGCDFYMTVGGSGAEKILDLLSSGTYGGCDSTVIGCRFTAANDAANQYIIRLFNNGGTDPQTVTMSQCLIRTLNGGTAVPGFQINTGATSAQKMFIKNMLGIGTATGGITFSISGSANNGSTWTNSRVKGTSPTNYATAFPAGSATFNNTTGPDLDSNDVPTAGGNIDGTGASIGLVGLCDIYGRPFLGGTWTPGCAQNTAIVSGQKLYPDVWV